MSKAYFIAGICIHGGQDTGSHGQWQGEIDIENEDILLNGKNHYFQ